MGWQIPICQKERRPLMGWQILSLPKRTENFNGLANSDLPKRTQSFKKSIPAGICRIGVRQPITYAKKNAVL